MAREARVGMGLGDRLILLVAWIATCGLVYLLGFYVGKGTQEHRLGLEERIVRLPVASPPPGEGRRQPSKSEFGFYDKLMGEHGAERAADRARPAPPPAPAAAPAVAVAKPTPPPPPPAGASVKPTPPGPGPVKPAAPVLAPAAAAVKPTPPASAPIAAVAKPSPPAPVPAVVAPIAAKSPPPAPARESPVPADVPAKAAAPAAPAPVAAAVQAPGAGWTVLANPTRSREEADGLARQLRTRGYDANPVRVLRDGETWYRVQVGRFATSEQASELMHRLREHEGVSHVFVASE